VLGKEIQNVPGFCLHIFDLMISPLNWQVVIHKIWHWKDLRNRITVFLETYNWPISYGEIKKTNWQCPETWILEGVILNLLYLSFYIMDTGNVGYHWKVNYKENPFVMELGSREERLWKMWSIIGKYTIFDEKGILMDTGNEINNLILGPLSFLISFPNYTKFLGVFGMVWRQKNEFD